MYVQTIARIIADKLGLKVLYSDTVDTFMIGKDMDGQLVIYMSSKILKVYEGHEEELEAMTRGALAHEALGHGFHTTFEDRAKTTYGQSFANALEDVRIERLAPSRYPGAKRSLSEMARLLIEKRDFWNPKDPIMEEALLVGLLRHFRSSILGQPIPADLTDTLLEQARKEIGEVTYGKIYDIAKGACFAASTKEVCEASDAIVEILRAAKKPPQPQQAQEPPPDEGDGDAGDDPSDSDQQDQDSSQDGENGNDGQGADDRDGGGQQQEAPEGNNPDPQADEGDAQESGGDPSTDGGSNEGSGEGGDDGQDKPGAVSGHQGEADEDGASVPPQESGQGTGVNAAKQGLDTAAAGDELIDFSDTVEVSTDVSEAVNDMLGEASEVEPGIRGECRDASESIREMSARAAPSDAMVIVQRMKRSLADSLRSTVEDEDDCESEHGRLDCSRIARIAAGFEKLPFFVDGEPGRGLSTELMVLFDKSGSMASLTSEFLRSLVYATGMTLASFAPDVRFNIAFFDCSSTIVHLADKHWTPEHGGKVAGAYLADGGTCWAQSALPLLPVLGRSRKARKVLMTVCDGDIDHDRYPGVMDEIRAMGIEATFVMIGKDVPAGLVGVSCENTGESFAKAFGQALLKAISAEFV